MFLLHRWGTALERLEIQRLKACPIRFMWRRNGRLARSAGWGQPALDRQVRIDSANDYAATVLSDRAQLTLAVSPQIALAVGIAAQQSLGCDNAHHELLIAGIDNRSIEAMGHKQLK
jgi:hypothetical protein